MNFGYTLIYVDDVPHSMAFYEKAFGLQRGFLHESLQYGEMITGETKLGFVHHETAQSHGFQYEKIDLKNTAPSFEIGFVTKDVDFSFKKAVEAGAIPISEPKTKPWGQTVAYVKDCNGILVEICSPIL